MKLSIYNSCIDINSRHTLLYNSFSGSFVVVRDQSLGLADLNKIALEKTTNNLFCQLCKAGMLIDDDIDEPAQLQQQIELSDNNRNEFILHINPTLDCNFRCWYCYENHIPQSMMEESTIHSIQAFIKTVVSDSKICKLDLGFFGGEPLLYFAKIAKPIIEFANNICEEFNKDLRVHFTSNAALLTDKTIDYLSQGNCGFQITLDGSKETHDRTRCFKNGLGSYDIIVKNVRKLLSCNISVIVRVNYTSANVDNVAAIENSFDDLDEYSKKKLCFDFQRVWQDNGDKDDETDVKIKSIRSSFRVAGFSVLANHLSRNIRESCYGDKTNYALINYNGEVFGCTARDFTHTNRIGILERSGRIVYDEEKYHKRKNSKFSKAVCKQCRIAPLCGGGCRQRALEASDSSDCSMGYSDSDIDRIITDIFEHQFNLNT